MKGPSHAFSSKKVVEVVPSPASSGDSGRVSSRSDPAPSSSAGSDGGDGGHPVAVVVSGAVAAAVVVVAAVGAAAGASAVAVAAVFASAAATAKAAATGKAGDDPVARPRRRRRRGRPVGSHDSHLERVHTHRRRGSARVRKAAWLRWRRGVREAQGRPSRSRSRDKRDCGGVGCGPRRLRELDDRRVFRGERDDSSESRSPGVIVGVVGGPGARQHEVLDVPNVFFQFRNSRMEKM